MYALYYIIFALLPYAVVVVFIAGIIYRCLNWFNAKGLTGLCNVNLGLYEHDFFSTSADVLKRVFLFYTLPGKDKDNALFAGSFMFHWGIWIVLFGHLGIILPENMLSKYFGITPAVHHTLALYLGGAGGLMALAGLLILIYRRFAGSSAELRIVNSYNIKIPVNRFSYIDDFFADFLLLAIIMLGLLQTLGISPFYPSYIQSVSLWMYSLLTFHPQISYIISEPILQAHAVLAMILVAYFPWGKLIHPFSYLFMPTISRPSLKVEYGGEKR
jgi:nitrate reductase gamma subunit